MIISGNYNGCRAFIRYSEENAAVDAIIVGHNKEYMTIAVRGQLSALENNTFVTVIIMQSDSVYEYRGKLRRSPFDNSAAEIALFKGQLKESRQSKRYTINVPAIVGTLVCDGIRIPIPHPVNVMVINLSTSGVLVTAPIHSFPIDMVIEVKLCTETSITAMDSKIIRVRNIDANTDEYGCVLVAAY